MNSDGGHQKLVGNDSRFNQYTMRIYTNDFCNDHQTLAHQICKQFREKLVIVHAILPFMKASHYFDFHMTWSPTESNTKREQLLRTFDEGLKRTGRTYGLLRRMTIVSFMDRSNAPYVCK